MLPEQCRAARALLGITQVELARAAEAGNKTVSDFEGSRRRLHAITLRALHTVLENLGVEFIDSEGPSPGVRLKMRLKGKTSANKAAITLQQCKAAREFLKISQRRLAALAGLSQMSIRDFERGIERDYTEATLHSIRTALEKAGIAFIDSNGGGPGVRQKK